MSGIVSAGAAVVGSVIGSSGAKSAARTSAAAADRATEEQRRQFDITQEQMAPWRTAGARALNQLSRYGRSQVSPGQYIPQTNIPQFDVNTLNLYRDPGYQFRLAEQERGINRAAAGMGNLMSGKRLEDIMARSGDLASQEYGNMYNRALTGYGMDVAREEAQYGRGVGAYGRAYGEESDYLNRLAAVSNVGQTTANQLGAYGAQTAGNIGSNIIQAGQAGAAAQIGGATATQNLLGDLSSIYARSQYRPPNPYYNPAGGNYSPNPSYTPKPWDF